MYQKLAECMQSLQINNNKTPTTFQPMDCLFQLKRIYVPACTDFNDHDALQVFLEINTGKEILTSQLYALPSRERLRADQINTLPYADRSMLCYDLSHDHIVGLLLNLTHQLSAPNSRVSISCKCILNKDMYVECGSCMVDLKCQQHSHRTIRMLFNKDSPLKGGYCDIQTQLKDHDASLLSKV